MFMGERFTIDPINNLLVTVAEEEYVQYQYRRQTVLGKRGIEIREGSGERGYFEVRIVCAFDMGLIGLATHEVSLHGVIGGLEGSLGWEESGNIISQLPGTLNRIQELLFGIQFHDNDVVGLMVDCTEVPRLLFFVNGVLVCSTVVGLAGHGQVLFPAFCIPTFNYPAWRLIRDSGPIEVHIASNPDLPPSPPSSGYREVIAAIHREEEMD